MGFWAIFNNPIALAAITVVAIGVILFERASEQRERNHRCGGRGGKPYTGPGGGRGGKPDTGPGGGRGGKPDTGPGSRRGSGPNTGPFGGRGSCSNTRQGSGSTSTSGKCPDRGPDSRQGSLGTSASGTRLGCKPDTKNESNNISASRTRPGLGSRTGYRSDDTSASETCPGLGSHTRNESSNILASGTHPDLGSDAKDGLSSTSVSDTDIFRPDPNGTVHIIISPASLPNSDHQNSQTNLRKRRQDQNKNELRTESEIANHRRDNNQLCGMKENLSKSSCNSLNDIKNSNFDEKNYVKNVFENMKDVKKSNKEIAKEVLSKNPCDGDSESNENNSQEVEKEILDKDIGDEKSDSSESNASVNSNETKLLNISISEDLNQLSKAAENDKVFQCIDKNDQDIAGLSVTNGEVSRNASDSKKEIYKKEVCDTMMKDLENMNQCDDKDKNLDLVNHYEDTEFDTESSICKVCEKPANATCYPCNHCYMCLDCALVILKIYQKCAICDAFVVKTLKK